MEPDDTSFDLFLQVYGTLPRAGPGGDDHTLSALGFVPGPPPTSVLDLGCGPGAQTLALAAALPQAQFLAMDLLPSMVAEASGRITEAGFADRVAVVVGDMTEPPVDPGTQDLIWCEGAIYNLGVTEALRAWRPLLRSGGSVAFSEPVWLVESPPQEVFDWWSSQYPPISDRAGVVERVEAAAYRVVASFVLPGSAWWDEYYLPMQDRIAGLREQFPDDPTALAVATAAEAEIDYFQRFADCYSYEFFIVQPTD